MAAQRADPTSDNILDAALRVLVDFGVKRSTVELIATSAGVSHMTVYRRWATKNEVLHRAVRRDFEKVVDAAFEHAATASAVRDRVLEAFAELVWTLRGHPLVVRELTTEPDVLYQIMADHSGASLDATVDLVADRLRRLSADEQLADPDALAEVFVRLGHSLVFFERSERPLQSRSEVRAYAAETLGPLAATASVPTAAASPARRRTVPLVAATVAAAVLLAAGAMLPPVARDVLNTDVERTEPTTPAQIPTPPIPTPTVAEDPRSVVPPPPPAPPATVAAERDAPSTSTSTSRAPRVNEPTVVPSGTGDGVATREPTGSRRPPPPRGSTGSIPPPRPGGFPAPPGGHSPGFDPGPNGSPGGPRPGDGPT